MCIVIITYVYNIAVVFKHGHYSAKDERYTSHNLGDGEISLQHFTSLNCSTACSGLVPNHILQEPCIPPPRDDWDHLFQPMFDEYFTPPSIDAPSISTPSTQEQEQSLNISQGFEELPKTPIFRDDPLNESSHVESTSQGSSSNMRQTHTLFKHLGKWTKDYPRANMISNPSYSVSTRKQLQTDAMWCYFDAFLTSIEPKNFK
nr:integrase, catalytic region, zinc finger, CCHC-type, peptidase aspartic, catalytic [Tanacetum cinerariifolium]